MSEDRIDVPLGSILVEPPTVVYRNSDANRYSSPRMDLGEPNFHEVRTSISEILSGVEELGSLSDNQVLSLPEKNALGSVVSTIRKKLKEPEFAREAEKFVFSHEDAHRNVEVRTRQSITNSEMFELVYVTQTVTEQQRVGFIKIKQLISTYDELHAVLSSFRLNPDNRGTALEIGSLAAIVTLVDYIGQDAQMFEANTLPVYTAMASDTSKDWFQFNPHILAYVTLATRDLDYTRNCQSGDISKEQFLIDVRETARKLIVNPEEVFSVANDKGFFMGTDRALTDAAEDARKYVEKCKEPLKVKASRDQKKLDRT